MADGGEARAAWLDKMLDLIEREGLEIRRDDDADIGVTGYAICTVRGGVKSSGPTINDALIELDLKRST